MKRMGERKIRPLSSPISVNHFSATSFRIQRSSSVTSRIAGRTISAPAAVSVSAGKFVVNGDASHSGGLGGLDAIYSIFDHAAGSRHHVQPPCRLEKYVRMRLAAEYILASHDGRESLERNLEHRRQVGLNFDRIGTRRDRTGNALPIEMLH